MTSDITAGHRFDYDTPIEETVCLPTLQCLRWLWFDRDADARPPRCCQSRIRAIHWNELVPCLSMYVLSVPLFYRPSSSPAPSSSPPTVQFMLCRVRVDSISTPLAVSHFCAFILYQSDYAIQNNLTPFISMQNHHSLIYREEEREMLPTLKVCRSSSHRG